MNKRKQSVDLDPIETKEWIEALQAVIESNGHNRALFLLQQLDTAAKQWGLANSDVDNGVCYANTLTSDPNYPGDLAIEKRIDAINRWNAMIMVVRAAKKSGSLGGHVSTCFSISRLYEVGFNHHFRAPSKHNAGDLVFFQGHAAEINYARGFLEGRFNKWHLDNFRQEVSGHGLSSYPHPWLMPNYWQFPTVSMGLGLIQAIYQAHVAKYLAHRDLVDTQHSRVWYFAGDGEMDEPESRGALAFACRYQLDNLTLVINCNLQCLDGPVFANGSIINELERLFYGCGWHVIKVMWGCAWDEIINKDKQGLLLNRMRDMPDGELQNYSAKDGAYIRKHFFNTNALQALVAKHSDDRLLQLFRQDLGGHDFVKIHSAFSAAKTIKAKPTVILVRSVKGFGLGAVGEGKNIAHNVKKISIQQLQTIRDGLNIALSDQAVADLHYYHPGEASVEVDYIKAKRLLLNGMLPQRRQKTSLALEVPTLTDFSPLLEGSGDREISTTMVFVRLLSILLKSKSVGKHVVPIVPDESRTFGMEGLFRQYGIYDPCGQRYVPEDRQQLMYYRQAVDGQVIEEGLNEAGAMSAWMAASTAYSCHNFPMIAFYIYYSMFGFQRVGDLAWAAGDIRARGFLIGATSGRTTLSGEGLQHNDGHSHIFSSVIPNCISYDVTYGYELAIVIAQGLHRMFTKQEDVFYYLTVTNENYCHPKMPTGVESGVIKGMYRLCGSHTKHKHSVQLLGCGAILREVQAAASLLEQDHHINADVWSTTSFTELRRQGLAVRRWNMLHPNQPPKLSYVEECLTNTKGPVIAASDYLCAFADQIREWVPRRYVTLGTDGFGRSDTRENLRRFHEVDRYFVVIAALKALADQGEIPSERVITALKTYHIDAKQPQPSAV